MKEENPNGSLSYALTLTTGLFCGYWESPQDFIYTKHYSTPEPQPWPRQTMFFFTASMFCFFLKKQQLWSYFKGPKKHFQKGRGLLCMVCFRGIGDRGWGHWFGGLIAQWGIYRVPWDKEWVTGSLWTQAKEETKALESRVSLFTQTASFLFSCSNSNCYSMLKAHGFLFSKMKSEQIQNPGGGIFSLSHTASLPWPRHPASP